jgi:hypothetical protein
MLRQEEALQKLLKQRDELEEQMEEIESGIQVDLVRLQPAGRKCGPDQLEMEKSRETEELRATIVRLGDVGPRVWDLESCHESGEHGEERYGPAGGIHHGFEAEVSWPLDPGSG